MTDEYMINVIAHLEANVDYLYYATMGRASTRCTAPSSGTRQHRHRRRSVWRHPLTDLTPTQWLEGTVLMRALRRRRPAIDPRVAQVASRSACCSAASGARGRRLRAGRGGALSGVGRSERVRKGPSRRRRADRHVPGSPRARQTLVRGHPVAVSPPRVHPPPSAQRYVFYRSPGQHGPLQLSVTAQQPPHLLRKSGRRAN